MTRSTTPEHLEQDLRAAQLHGRWLSDDELEAWQHEQQQTLQCEEQRQQRRLRLMILTGVCLLMPPLWPLALGLTLYLLFPQTMRRVGVVAGIVLVTGAIAITGLLTVFTVWLMTLLF